MNNNFVVKIISSSPMSWYADYIGYKFSVFLKKNEDLVLFPEDKNINILIPDYMFDMNTNEKFP